MRPSGLVSCVLLFAMVSGGFAGMGSAGDPAASDPQTATVSDPLPADAAASKILLQRRSIDTSSEPSLLSLESDPAPKTGQRLVYVKMSGPVLEEWRDSLEAGGVEILSYAPENAYVARLTPSTQLGALALPFVSWVGDVETMDRIDPALDGAQGTVSVNILVADPGSAGKVAHHLARSGATVPYASQNTPAIVMSQFAAERLAEVADLPGVMWIEPSVTLVPLNENVSKNNQNWNQFQTTVWNRGLHGENLIASISDTGLNINHSAFSSPGKVCRYYVMPGATIGDNPANAHGSHTAGTLAGDDPARPDVRGSAYKACIDMIDVGAIGQGGANSLAGIPGDLRDMYIIAYNFGSRTISNSWGQPSAEKGSYNTFTLTSDLFVWEHPEMAVYFSQGNNGHGSPGLMTPVATGKNLVSVG
ncbi:MAG TPA: S8 family serine peptidase, partial [Thermoplasmata archaeon]|nr:S8 family serine peptidase [Thermoplasmata archaeon]